MMKKEKWIVAPKDEGRIALLQQGLGISHLAASVLAARGVGTVDEALTFMDCDWKHLHDPFLIADMDKAVDILEDAIAKGERIAIYGDYDVDGITATAIMIRYLTGRGADCRYYIPDRLNEGYGLNEAALSGLKEDGCTLLITVDSGITATQEIEHARKLGIRVIVTDHHECAEVLPNADAVVNPRRADSAYPFRELAGVGVAFKLICAMEKERPIQQLLDEYVDVVALGTIADVMPVIGENRIIISEGLKRLRHTENLGLRTLMQKLGLESKPLTANSVSFVLAPRINAAGRMGEADCTARLMLTSDPKEAFDLAEYLCDLNRRRQEEENAVYEQIISQIEKDPALASGKIMVLWGDGWHTGVIGIVSSRLADRYGMPCVLISMCGDSGKGSGRSIKGFNLYEALGECSDLLERYGGHELAGGLSISRENLEALRARLEACAERCAIDEPLEPSLNIDCAIDPRDLTIDSVKSLSVLEPFGMSNPMPLFVLSGATIEEVTPISHDRHVKLLFSKNGYSFYGFVFGMGARSCPFVAGDEADLVFSAEINYFRGRESVQLVVKDIRWGEEPAKCDAYAQNVFVRFAAGEEITAEEARYLCPCREDLVAAFRHVRANQSSGMLCGMPQTIYRRIKYESKCCMNQGRFLICMDIFKEFDIFDYELVGDNIAIRDLLYKGKVDINGSRILKKLMEVIKG